MQVVGVDGCKGGWVAVELEDTAFRSAGLFATLADVLAAFPNAVSIGVDVPIGLPPPFPREADTAAKAFLGGPAAASVFPTFPRGVYEAVRHADAVALCHAVGLPGISRQSHAIGPRILEADALVGDVPHVIEVHPEVSFRALAGRPLSPKKTWTGDTARREALASAGIVLPTALGEAGRAAPDDVLDAAVAAWSARRVARGEQSSLPEKPQPGERVRLVAIWY